MTYRAELNDDNVRRMIWIAGRIAIQRDAWEPAIRRHDIAAAATALGNPNLAYEVVSASKRRDDGGEVGRTDINDGPTQTTML